MSFVKSFSIFSSLILIFPVLVLLYLGLFVFRNTKVFTQQFFLSILLSLTASALALIIIFLLFTPLAYYLARHKDFFIETLVDLPASIPHPIVGIALVFLTSPYSPLGFLYTLFKISLFDNLLGLVSALVIVSAPIYIKTLKSYFQAFPESYEIFARSLGYSQFSVLYKILIPISFRGIITALLISLSRAMSEFGSIAIIAYYILHPPFNGISPASVIIYDYYTYYGPETAVTASAVLIIIGFIITLSIRIVESKSE
jgi:molybdate/tungstate transport system permease protein